MDPWVAIMVLTDVGEEAYETVKLPFSLSQSLALADQVRFESIKIPGRAKVGLRITAHQRETSNPLRIYG